ncbi:MAG: hypothetical protein OIF32_11185 [Campylobacterales bacterium]|nr:hypothetical protein [Campylobacterales bacterium]
MFVLPFIIPKKIVEKVLDFYIDYTDGVISEIEGQKMKLYDSSEGGYKEQEERSFGRIMIFQI